jgi:predicted ATPase
MGSSTEGSASEALLERENELWRIGGALDALSEGLWTLVVLQGPGGIGKTRLVRAALELARVPRLQVVSATGGELERELSFGLVGQLFGGSAVQRTVRNCLKGPPRLPCRRSRVRHRRGRPRRH